MSQYAVGTVIDRRYRVVGHAGTGGSGSVYRTVDLLTDQHVALKVLHRSIDDGEVRRRFHREFQLLARVSHPGIVRTLGWGAHDGRPYFTMEWVSGETLEKALSDVATLQELRRGSFAHFVGQIAKALGHIHHLGMVHRDVKPSNIMLSRSSCTGGFSVTILDLGLARFRERGNSAITELGVTVGTAEYMSPEQGRGSWVDQRSDLYSLGVVLYELLVGSPPFRGRSPVSVILKHIWEVPPPLPESVLDSGVSAQGIVLRLLEKEPIARYQSAADLLLDLGKIGHETEDEATLRRGSAPRSYGRVLKPQFVGRHEEMGLLRSMLSKLSHGRGSTVVISGEAGIGKSHLLEELQGDARIGQIQVLRGACYEKATRAYGPLIDALRETSDRGRPHPLLETDGGSLSLLEWIAGPHNSVAEMDEHSVLDALMQKIRDACRSTAILLCLEDMQWADEESLRFLRLYLRDPEELPLMVCLTCRTSNEIPPSSMRVMLEDRVVRDVAHLRLCELDEKCVGYLTASMLGESEVPAEPSSWIYKQTGGNPLFVIELMRSLLAEDLVHRDDQGFWRWAQIPQGMLPERAGEAFRRRIASLGQTQRQVLEYASVLRGAFAFDLLASMWKGDELSLLETVDELSRSGLLREEAGTEGWFEFSHAMLQEAVYADLRPRKRELLHREAGMALEEMHGDSLDEAIDDLAYHFAGAGVVPKAVSYLKMSGSRALQACAYSHAMLCYQETLVMASGYDHGLRGPDCGNLVDSEFLSDYANALLCCDRICDAAEQCESAVRIAEADAPGTRARALRTRGKVLVALRGYDEAERDLADSLRIYQDIGDTASEVEALAGLSALYAVSGRVGEAIKYSLDAADRCARLDGPVYEGGAGYYRAYAAFLDRRFRDSRSFLESALHILSGVENSTPRLKCLVLLGEVVFSMGDFEGSAQILEQLQSHWQRRGAKGAEARVLALLGDNRAELGEPDRAISSWLSAETLVAEVGDDHRLYRIRARIAETFAEIGDADRASEWAEKARPGTELPGVTASIVHRGIASALNAAGDFARAEEEFGRAADCGGPKAGFEGTRSLLAAGCFHLARRNLGTARQLLQTAQGAFDDLGLIHFTQRAADLLQSMGEEHGDETQLAEYASRLSQGRLLALYDGIQGLARQLNLEALLDQILGRLREVTRAERAMVSVRKASEPDATMEAVRLHNVDDEAAEQISQTVVKHVADRNEPLLIQDALADERFKATKSVVDYHIRSVLCVPLRGPDGSVLGALYSDHRGIESAFTEEDLAFVSAFASLASAAVVNARLHTALQKRSQYLQTEVEDRDRYDSLVGRSEAMQDVYVLLERSASIDVTVLLRGETGTGKELAARAIHYNSPRHKRPFQSVNCASFPEELLQSELFGHCRGAFTGASDDREGIFEAADGGTVFLDEIGDSTPQVQASLLRVLQEGEIRRVGDSRARKVDVRVVAATNRDLEEVVREASFREDLYYRLRVMQIELPPLRDRQGDVPLLAGHLLRTVAEEVGKSVGELTLSAVETLVAYQWPGNVRELENEIRRAVALVEEAGDITPELFSDAISGSLDADLDTGGSLKACVEAFERNTIHSVLRSCGGNVTKAAARLGLTRSGLYKKMKKFRLRDGES